MQGDPGIIRLLNAVLTNELTAVNQYFLHARMYDNWGFKRLGKITYDESIGEMKHADMLINRILFLEGLPNLQDLHKLKIGETVPECLNSDLQVELGGRETLIPGIIQCEQARDYVSRELLREILSDTEEHIDFLETQLSLVKSLGEANYLQSAMGELPS
ncbi:bacterioferritin [Caulobacter segnis]|jgi:bacterioferritin|uniref:Bacterioferritin n=3 Tax=Caulobacter segnis TaxID=88688 RepID=D5VEM6_CAUST|nr:bacterioferritin [Caulobacter segnis]ADG09169.1 bacterioferritin [Caulobacter segnis ATCC 21756]AVQ00984.1 bacterioferritin [Caulobacter segnis]